MAEAVVDLQRRLEAHRAALDNTAALIQGLEGRVIDLEVKAGISKSGRLGASGFDPGAEVLAAWLDVHTMLSDAQARVPRNAFVEYCLRMAPPGTPKRPEYTQYLNELFTTATALMLPSKKNDLGKHCFGYAMMLAGEFYFDKPLDRLSLTKSGALDGLQSVRSELDADWASVPKDEVSGRVSLDGFKYYMIMKHGARLTPETQGVYEQFLEQNFRSALSMMLPEQKDTLGGHCFRYASLMAGEFYFDAAKDAFTGCGCSAPVADVLGVTAR